MSGCPKETLLPARGDVGITLPIVDVESDRRVSGANDFVATASTNAGRVVFMDCHVQFFRSSISCSGGGLCNNC